MKKDINKTEDQLIEEWYRGDEKAFTYLYEIYKSRVYSFIIRMVQNKDVAEDIMQETFIAAMNNKSQFNPDKRFLSWVFGIAHKKTIDFFRHKKVEQKHGGESGNVIGTGDYTPDRDAENKRIRETVNEIVNELEPPQKEVFLMRETSGMSFKEIAETMDSPLNTALGRMRLALKNIRKELKQRGIHGVQ